MSHLLKSYRGKVDLIYIDPPFDSKADYKKNIQLKGKIAVNDYGAFEEKQYTDIWTNDEYLQFMYERLIIIRELLSDKGSIWVHCDFRKNSYLRIILDEIFGPENLINEVTWRRGNSHNDGNKFGIITDTLYWYSKTANYSYQKIYLSRTDQDTKSQYPYIDETTGKRYKSVSMNAAGQGEPRVFGNKGLLYPPPGTHWRWSQERINDAIADGLIFFTSTGVPRYKQFADDIPGNQVQNIWADFMAISSQAEERLDYPTQKPEALLDRIITSSSMPGDLVLDCFMGSGTTQAVAMKLGRRFVGADINAGAIQITTKRLMKIAEGLQESTNQRLLDISNENKLFLGLEVLNVNHYDVFRNPAEAKDLLLSALEVQQLAPGHLFDGEKDGRMVKIMPVNRIATRADLSELIAGFDYKAFDRRQTQNPGKPVEKVTLVCMGHEPDLAAHLKNEVLPYNIDVEVVDILRDKQDLQFKRDAEAKLAIKSGQLVIEAFYPMNLLQKLSMQQENVTDWRELVESIMIDWNYDGAVLQPAVIDVPEGSGLVKGKYSVPQDAGTIRVKITDLLSESLEIEVANA
jgi:site-specific DNA-methyltransferase (adenine-specific)/adenine-specific DNA-methyltransferase